jgi:rSAM/selenodomain-associated transferase 2
VSYTFSVIIPVLNEPMMINQTVEHVYSLGSDFEMELIVVDGDKEAKTIREIRNGDVIKSMSPKGRGRQMNKGASLAHGDILLFLHTDTELPEGAFTAISSIMSKVQCVAGSFDLGIKSERLIFRLVEQIVRVRTRITRIPYGDQAIFLKREVFNSMKGYREIPLMEDVDLMRRIKKSGGRICIIPQKVKTSPRRWEREGILYCTLRNRALIGFYHLGVDPEKLVKFYYKDW